MTTALATTSSTPAGFGALLNPVNIDAAKDLAKTLANSGLVPQAYENKPDKILIAGAMGARLGLDIFSALAGIAVVNGRPTLWGDAQLAVCQARQDWGGMKVEWSGNGDATTCTVTIIRKGVEPVSASFSIEDAIIAGLWGKVGPWKQYPRRMVEMRARAFAIRAAYADALMGFAQREEVEDMEDVTSSARVIPDAVQAKIRTLPSSPAAVDQVDSATVSAEITTGPASGAEEEPVIIKEIEVEDIQKEMTVLWNLKPGGKEKGKEIMVAWKLSAISEMGGSDQEQRGRFLDVIEFERKALVKAGAK